MSICGFSKGPEGVYKLVFNLLRVSFVFIILTCLALVNVMIDVIYHIWPVKSSSEFVSNS